MLNLSDLQESFDKIRKIVDKELPPTIEGFTYISPADARSMLEELAGLAQELADELFPEEDEETDHAH